MVWIRFGDEIPHHPKFVDAGALASWLWVCGNAYCNKYLTDGFIPKTALKSLGNVPNAEKLARKLLDVGLWELAPRGYRVHDFHEYNPKASEVKRRREAERKRKEAAKE